jgi:hypothetical protein
MCDIPGAFLQADNPDYVLMQLDGILAELTVQVAPSLYRKYVTTNAKGKAVLCSTRKSCLWHDEKCSSFLPQAGCRPYFSWI